MFLLSDKKPPNVVSWEERFRENCCSKSKFNAARVTDAARIPAAAPHIYHITDEKVKILNRIIFDVHKFTGDTENYHHSKNSFLSSVLERKKGNPISLAVIYSIVAQRLNIPIYGVNLPQHFILGYVKDLEWPPLLRFNDESLSRESQYNDILFYINPFNNGLIFNQENIHKFLKQLKLEVKEDYFKIFAEAKAGNKPLSDTVIQPIVELIKGSKK